jgi:hypothetical protein
LDLLGLLGLLGLRRRDSGGFSSIKWLEKKEIRAVLHCLKPTVCLLLLLL